MRTNLPCLFTCPNIATASLLLCCLFFGKIPLSWNIKVGFLLLSFAALLPLTFIFQQRSKLDKVIGELSYPIYIVHMLAIWLIKSAMSVGEVTFGKTSETVLCISVSCIMTYCLNATISTRVEKLRSRVRLNRNAT